MLFLHHREGGTSSEGAVRLAGNSHGVQAFAIDRDGVDFWGMRYTLGLAIAHVGRYLRLSGRVAPDVADDLEAAESDAGAAARLSTTMQDQTTPRRTVELANWLARF